MLGEYVDSIANLVEFFALAELIFKISSIKFTYDTDDNIFTRVSYKLSSIRANFLFDLNRSA